LFAKQNFIITEESIEMLKDSEGKTAGQAFV
jgi:hypothetical protein